MGVEKITTKDGEQREVQLERRWELRNLELERLADVSKKWLLHQQLWMNQKSRIYMLDSRTYDDVNQRNEWSGRSLRRSGLT